MSKSDYISKMNVVLDDDSKFLKLGPVETHDRTHIVENNFVKYLLELRSTKQISEAVYGNIRPREGHSDLECMGSLKPTK